MEIYKLSTLKLSLLFFMLIFLNACNQFAPFEDRRREPATERIYVGSSKPTHPVICYNPLFHNKNKVEALAQGVCSKNVPDSTATLIKDDSFSCRLFVPSKAYYECVVDK